MEMKYLMIIVFTLQYVGQILSDMSNVRDPKMIICVPGIKRFSSNDRYHYYSCENPGDVAVLTKCPGDQFYWAVKQKCFSISETDATSQSTVRRRRSIGSSITSNEKPVIEDREILGNTVVGLGDLYDAKRDRFLVGASLWSGKTIEKSKRQQNQLSSKITYSAKKTLNEKLDELKIAASLKLDFLGGLVSVSGSAEFYRQSSSLENEETFHVMYETRSHADVLPVRTPQDYVKFCASKEATHVVSQVIYGQRGFLSFKQKSRSRSEQQNIKGSLHVIVKNAFLSVSGQASVELKAAEKELSENTEIKMSGDFIRNTLPVSFAESIEMFKQLAKNHPSKKDLKPVKVQLTPLWKYCDKSTTVLIRISKVMITEVVKMLDNIEKLDIKVKTLLSSRPSVKFQAVQRNLEIYATSLKKFQLKIKGKLQVILPEIRGGKKGKSEADLNQLINEYLSSPMTLEKSSRFLSRRNREIRAIEYLLDHFDATNQKNIELEDYESANDVRISLSYPTFVIFAVNILQPKEVAESFVGGNEVDESIFWFNNLSSVGSLGIHVRQFKQFAAANKGNPKLFYLVKINKKQANPFDIKASKGIVQVPFQIPIQPEKPTVISKTHESFTIKVLPSTNPFVKKFFIVYWDILEGEEKAKKTKLLSFSPIMTHKIKDLSSSTYYQYRVVHCTEFGNSSASPAGDIVMTTPFSPPTDLALKDKTPNLLMVTWKQPSKIGKGIIIDGYKASIYNNSTLIGKKVVKKKIVTFPRLLPAHKYTIKLVAITTLTVMLSNETGNVTDHFFSNPSTIELYTLPPPPHTLNVVSTELNSISLTWNQPVIAREAQLIKYQIMCHEWVSVKSMNNGGTVRLHNEHTTKTHTNISGLVQGIPYGFSVKMITSLGSSPYSKMLLTSTQRNFTELERLKESMEISTNNSLQPLRDSLQALNDSVNDVFSSQIDNAITVSILAQNTAAKEYQLKHKKDVHFAIDFRKDTITNIPKIENVKFPATNGISICFWYKTKQYHSWYNTVVLYVTPEIKSDNDFGVWVRDKNIVILMRKSGDEIILKRFPIGVWAHICWVWESSGRWNTYLNGTKKESGFSSRAELKGQFPKTSGYVLLGQDTDIVQAKDVIDDPSQLFSGELTQVYIYHSKLTDSQVFSAFKNSPSKENVVTGWWQFKGKTKGNDIVETQYPF